MKNRNTIVTLAGGVLMGFALALCLAAEPKPKETPKPAAAEAQKTDWSRLKLVSYPNGTGFFDPDTGILYVYDTDLRTCFIARQLVTLGQPMQWPR